MTLTERVVPADGRHGGHLRREHWRADRSRRDDELVERSVQLVEEVEIGRAHV